MRKLAVAILLGLAAGVAGAQSWPQRPVTLIVPFPTGGSTDTAAREIEKWWPIIKAANIKVE